MRKVNKNSASYKVGQVIGWFIVTAIAMLIFLLLFGAIKEVAGWVF